MKGQKQNKATQKEIARTLGISPSTVSMVIRGVGSISEEMRRKIIETAQDIGYSKKIAETTLEKNNQPRYIAILEYEHFDYQWNFIKPFLLSLGRELNKDFCYPVFYHGEKGINWKPLQESIIASKCSALCSIHYFDMEFFNSLTEQGIFVILLNNNIYQNRFSAVCTDDFQGVYNGVTYLVGKGHRKIIYFDYIRPDFEACVTDRYMGFLKAAEEFRIDYNNRKPITLVLEDKENLTKKFHSALEEFSDVTAIVFHDDYLASWGISEMGKMGKRIPEDISVIAPGDTLDFSEPFTPHFTTIQIDTITMGALASQIIKEKIRYPESEIKLLKVTPTIVERGSCKSINYEHKTLLS